MLMNKPAISVILPCFNAAETVGAAIESIQAQTCSDFELIVIDDGSTDGSLAEIRKYSADSRLKIVTNLRNVGLIDTLNAGLRVAQAELIARMDADDISSPNRLEKQLEFLKDNPAVDVIGTNMVGFRSDGSTLNFEYPSTHEEILAAMLFFNPIAHPTVMMKKRVITMLDPFYQTRFLHAEDYAAWAMLSLRNIRFANLNEFLLQYRLSDKQVSSAKRNEQHASAQLVRKIFFDRRGYFPIWLGRLHNELCEVHFHLKHQRIWVVALLTASLPLFAHFNPRAPKARMILRYFKDIALPGVKSSLLYQCISKLRLFIRRFACSFPN